MPPFLPSAMPVGGACVFAVAAMIRGRIGAFADLVRRRISLKGPVGVRRAVHHRRADRAAHALWQWSVPPADFRRADDAGVVRRLAGLAAGDDLSEPARLDSVSWPPRQSLDRADDGRRAVGQPLLLGRDPAAAVASIAIAALDQHCGPQAAGDVPARAAVGARLAVSSSPRCSNAISSSPICCRSHSRCRTVRVRRSWSRLDSAGVFLSLWTYHVLLLLGLPDHGRRGR